MAYTTAQVRRNERVADGIKLLTVDWPEKPHPGQFFMLRPQRTSTLLPRAISAHRWEHGKLSFLYQVVGPGTEDLAELHTNETLTMLGPLGNGFDMGIGMNGRTALVAGGIGVAPFGLVARELSAVGNSPDLYAGYRDMPFGLDEIDLYTHRLLVSSEKGSFGHKGLVTELIDPSNYDAVFCCGPEPMMKAVTRLCIDAGTPVYVSLENKMACGIGACLVCTCHTRDGISRRVCKEGPVFRGEDVNFDA